MDEILSFFGNRRKKLTINSLSKASHNPCSKIYTLIMVQRSLHAVASAYLPISATTSFSPGLGSTPSLACNAFPLELCMAHFCQSFKHILFTGAFSGHLASSFSISLPCFIFPQNIISVRNCMLNF